MAAKSNSSNGFYEFGEFKVDADGRVLRRNGEIITLPPKVFDTLFLLVERRGSILTKNEILNAVWPDTFVEEGNLTQNIYLLRRTLGKTHDGKDWIETLPRKGYVFSGEVRAVDKNGVAEIESTQVYDSETKSSGLSMAIKLAIAAFVTVLIIAAGFFAYSRLFRSSESAAAARDVVFKKLTFSGDVEFPVISPDGHSFASSRNGRLFIQSLDNEQLREVKLPEKMEVGFLQFTPDGKSIAFRDQRQFYIGGDVYSLPVGGGEPTKLMQNVWSGFAFSPDGKQVAFIRDVPDESSHRLILHDLANSSERVLAELKGPTRFVLISSPAWSPDGSKIVTAVINNESGSPRSEMDVYEVATGAREQIAPQQLKQFEQPVWLLNGNKLAVIARENEKFFQVWEISYPGGQVAHITNDLNIYRGLSMTATGRKLLAANFTIFSHIWLADATNLQQQRQITSGNLNRDGTIGMQWLPDGTLVYASRIFGNVDLFRVGSDEVQKSQLTREAGDVNSYPELSPDGKTMYFTSTRTGNTQIWRMDAATGENQTQITFGEKEINYHPQVSPDGRSLYYIKRRTGETAIWKKPIDGGEDVKLDLGLSFPPDTFLALSPDGRFLAASVANQNQGENRENRKFKIAVIDTENHQKSQFFELPSDDFTWPPANAAFDYVENSNGTARILRQSLDRSPPQILFEEKGAYISRIAWNADGTLLAISKGKRLNDAVLITNF